MLRCGHSCETARADTSHIGVSDFGGWHLVDLGSGPATAQPVPSGRIATSMAQPGSTEFGSGSGAAMRR